MFWILRRRKRAGRTQHRNVYEKAEKDHAQGYRSELSGQDPGVKPRLYETAGSPLYEMQEGGPERRQELPT